MRIRMHSVMALFLFSSATLANSPRAVVNFINSYTATTANHCENRGELILPIYEHLASNPDLNRVELQFEEAIKKIESFPQFMIIKQLIDPGRIRIAFQMYPHALELAAYVYNPHKPAAVRSRSCWDLGDQVAAYKLYSREVIGRHTCEVAPGRFEDDCEGPRWIEPYFKVSNILGYPDAPMAENNKIVYEFNEKFFSPLLDQLVFFLQEASEREKANVERRQRFNDQQLAEENAARQAREEREAKMNTALERFKNNL